MPPLPANPTTGPDTGFIRLTTPRLLIRRFQPADVVAFSRYRSDPDVARYQSWEAPYSEQAAWRFVGALADAHPDTPGDWFQFAVVEAASQVLVGDVAAAVDAEDPRLATVGVTLAPAFQGRGYASEALVALLDYLFLDRGKHRVVADCDVRNAPVIAVLERLGMRREAHHVESVWSKGEWTSEYVYAVLEREWHPDRSAGPRGR